MNLHICKVPLCSQVVENLLNISKSEFTNFDLFDNYNEDLRHRGKEKLLFEVLVKCFDFLSRNYCRESEVDLQLLVNTPCIPVSINGDVSEIHLPVLVPPCQVIADSSELVTELVPFLNPLPEALYSTFPTVLSVIGVTQEIQYDNVRYALQLMHDHIHQPLDINTIEILKKLIKRLYFWLCTSGFFAPGYEVLYLPNDQRKLIESTKLVYNDREHYRDAHLNYDFMSLLVDKFAEWKNYGFCLRDVYSKLPESVRPLALSENCVEQLSSSCRQNEQLTDFAAKVKQALGHPKFAYVASLIIQAFSPSFTLSYSCKQFVQALSVFHQSVKVHSVDNLEINVLLKLIHSQMITPIGTAKVDFLLESNSCLLYTSDAAAIYSV